MKDYLLQTILLAVIFVGISGGIQVHAQGSEGLQIKPAIIEDRVDPGQTYRFTVSVTNLSENERTFFLLSQDIIGLDERGIPEFSEISEPTPYELSRWISLPQSQVTLKAGETVSVPFTVRVPLDASPGSHFGGIFLDSRPDPRAETGSAIGMRVGSIITLRIAGDITEEIRLREFSTERFIYDAPPVQFRTKVENTGNVLVRPNGIVEVSDMWGKKVGAVEVNESAAAVFPGGDRVYDVMWEYDGFALGRYQALLSFVYGEDGRKTVVRATSFWILPLTPILSILGGLLALVLLLYILVQRSIKKRLHAMGVSDHRGSAELYTMKHQRPLWRLALMAAMIVLFCIILLGVLFVAFA